MRGLPAFLGTGWLSCWSCLLQHGTAFQRLLRVMAFLSPLLCPSTVEGNLGPGVPGFAWPRPLPGPPRGTLCVPSVVVVLVVVVVDMAEHLGLGRSSAPGHHQVQGAGPPLPGRPQLLLAVVRGGALGAAVHEGIVVAAEGAAEGGAAAVDALQADVRAVQHGVTGGAVAGPRAGVAARPVGQVPAVLREIALPGAAAVVLVPVAKPPAQGGCTVLLLCQGCLGRQAGGLGLKGTRPVGCQRLPACRGVGVLLPQQAWGQRGHVSAGQQGGGWSVGHVVDGAKIQLGELWRVEEGVAVGWLWGKAPEVPLRIRVWEVVKGMSWMLAEKVESPSRLHVLRDQPGAGGCGLVPRVSGCGERKEHPAHIPQPRCSNPGTDAPLPSHHGPTSHPCSATPGCHH